MSLINQNSLLIGIVGVTGLVGKKLLNILYNYEYFNLKLCASDASENMEMMIGDKIYKLEKLSEDFLSKLHVVFFCADTNTSLTWVPIAQKLGVFVIDNSSAFRMNSNVPLVIPEINGHLIEQSEGIIANPNCCTALLCMVLYPLTKLSKILRVDVSTYQAVSGAGIAGVTELERQTKQYANNQPITKKTFESQIYGNCFSHNTSIDIESGYNEEELKISQETPKILGTNIKVSATSVRVGVYTSHSESVKIVFENPVEEADIIQALMNFDGVSVLNDRTNNKFPEPILANENTNVFVGRIRKDLHDNTKTVYNLFLCGDQLLKGASWNAFQIFKEYERLIIEEIKITKKFEMLCV